MPAEIDTGGPRVLHCDYRADCPIPILLSASNDDELLLRLSSPIVDGVHGRQRDQSEVSCLRRRCLHNHHYHYHRHHHQHQRRHHWRRWNLNLDHTKDIVTNEHIISQDVTGSPTSIIGPCSTATATVATFPGRRRSLSCPIETQHPRVPSLRKSFGRDRRYQRASSSSSSSSAGQQDRKLYSCKNFSNNDRTFVCKRSSCSKNRVILREEEERTSLSSHRSRSYSREKDIVSRANRSGSSSSTTTTTSSSFSISSSFSTSSSSRRFNSSWRRRKSSSFLGDSKCACRKNGRFYFQLAFLLFLLAFGHSGLLKSSSVLRFSARSSVTGLGVFAIGSIAVGVVSAAPIDLIADAGVRAERSANLSHITGASRKIQMYIKNRHLQILPDGTVNGSNDDTSDYTIFQRTSVSRGQLRIQGVATCLYLCMDSCGLLYGSREYTEDCVFNETLEQHNYNTYSSVRWSTAKKTLYLGLNRRGQPRRVQAKGHTLGRLSAYARVLTQVAPADRVEALYRRMLGAEHNVRHRHGSHAHRRQHHHQQQQVQQQEQHSELIQQQAVCPNLPAQEKDGRDRFRCRKRKKRKKRKRRCRPGEKVGPQCQLPEDRETISSGMSPGSSSGMNSSVETSSPESKRSCEGAASEEACRRQALSATSRKRKSRIGEEGEGEEEEEEGSPTEVPPEDAAATASTNSNDNATHEELLTTSIGKNLEQATSKKTNVAGTISQSKKPDLLDGKKRKMKKKKKKRKRGPASPRRSPLGARKRFESKQTGKEEEEVEEEDNDEMEEGEEVTIEEGGEETAEEEKEVVNNSNGTSSNTNSSRREPVAEIPLTTTSLLSSPSSSSLSFSNHSSSFDGARSSPKRKTAKTTKSPSKKNGSQALGARRNGGSSKSPRRGKALSVGSRRTTPTLRQRAIRPAAILDSSTTATATTMTMTTTTVTMTTTITTTTTSTIVPETRSTSSLSSLPRRDSTSSCCDTSETTTTNSPLASFAESTTEKKESNERSATERFLSFERLAM